MTLFASSYPYLSKIELKDLEKQSGGSAEDRIMDYTKTIKLYKNYSRLEQLEKVNAYLNQLPFKEDALNQQKSDYWETPKEFLTCGYGDCEDYVAIKYFTLIKLGFEKEKLFFTAVYEKYSGKFHMVLSYFQDNAQEPLILDNLSCKILDLKKREDLEAKYFINSSGVYKLDRGHALVKLSQNSRKFRELLERVENES